MKTLLRTLLILLIIGGMVAGGIYGYSRYALSRPVKVQPVSNWLLEYSPNQTYLGGSVTSGTSLILYGEKDRMPLEIFVHEGQTVRAGDPLIRYDTTKDSIDLDEKLLNRQKLYDNLQALYKEYKRYAHEEYERTIPTATPTATPTPRGYTGVSSGVDTELGIVRLSAPVRREVVRVDRDGDGSLEKPYRFQIHSKNGVPDPVPESLLTALQNTAVREPVYAWLETDIGFLFLRFLPPDTKAPKGSMHVTATTSEDVPTGILDANSLQPLEGDGSLNAPYTFSYTEGREVPGEFFARYSREASARGTYLYGELRGRKLTVTVDFTSMGTCILRMKITPEPTPTPTPSPEPTSTPTPTPTLAPTSTPEGWTDSPDIPYVPSGGGMSRAEQQAYVQELAQQIRDGEHDYKQLEHDIARLYSTTQNGTITSTIDGVVSKLDPNAQAGSVLLEIRGGSGKSIISCMLGETELSKYTIGTELTGFSYDTGDSVTAVVTYISPMPVTDSYSNGGNPNSSGYSMLLEVQGDVELPLFSYVEFTSFEPLSKTGAIYLYEAFVREIDGQDCIFVARDGLLKKVQVHTGRRAMEYIELVGSDLTREDYIAFPYDKNVRDGATVQITDGGW